MKNGTVVNCEAEDGNFSTSNTTLVEYCASRTTHFSSYNFRDVKEWVDDYDGTDDICMQEVEDDLEALKN